MLRHDWLFFNWFYKLFTWYRILSLWWKGSVISSKCSSPSMVNRMCLELKYIPFYQMWRKLTSHTSDFSKIFACDRVSITYLFAQNSQLYSLILYACVYTIRILTEYLVFLFSFKLWMCYNCVKLDYCLQFFRVSSHSQLLL